MPAARSSSAFVSLGGHCLESRVFNIYQIWACYCINILIGPFTFHLESEAVHQLEYFNFEKHTWVKMNGVYINAQFYQIYELFCMANLHNLRTQRCFMLLMPFMYNYLPLSLQYSYWSHYTCSCTWHGQFTCCVGYFIPQYGACFELDV